MAVSESSGGSAARGVPGGGGSGLPTANGRSEWSPCADSSARHAALEAASAAAAASASAAVFGEVNDSGGRMTRLRRGEVARSAGAANSLTRRPSLAA